MPGPEGLGRLAENVSEKLEKAKAAAQGPLQAVRGSGEQEKMLHNARIEYAEEAHEIATYMVIDSLATTVGDKQTAKLARDILRDEERMQKFLAELLPELTAGVAHDEIPVSEIRAAVAPDRGRLEAQAQSGNVGTSVLRSLAAEPAVESVVGVARRLPALEFAKTEWRQADVANSPLHPILQGADAVIHLAWLIQPGRDRELLHAVNVEGSRRVFQAVADASVPTVLYASSVGAYARGPKNKRVDEGWPASGVPTSFYSRHKAEVERLLDGFEEEHPNTRVVRLRPGLIFRREAASGICRLSRDLCCRVSWSGPS